MSFHFRKILRPHFATGFTLVEVGASLIILGIIVSTLLVGFNRYIETATNANLKMKAFETARENMERLLSVSEITDAIEYGVSEENPEIQWETVVETFYEPLTSRMWIRAISSADYLDTQGEEQAVELTHWITDVSKKQLVQIMQQKKRQQEYEKELAEQAGEEYNPEEPPVEPPVNPDPEQQEQPDQQEKICGYTIDELDKMPFDQIWKILSECYGL